MSYRIERIELYVRDTPPGRMVFSLGKKGGTGDVKKEMLNPLGHVQMIVRSSSGSETFGCAGDRLSVRWLDKRAGRTKDLKRRELVALIEQAREIYLKQPQFETPFEMWRRCHPQVMAAGKKAGQEDLSSSFASALMERAVVDAVCRLHKKSVFEMVKEDKLGFRPGDVHREVANLKFTAAVANRPRTFFHIRHTVGGSDPLTIAEVPKENRIDDGLPETLEEYVKHDGVRHFKIKISGNPDRDLKRLGKIWDIVVQALEPVITLDANEAYEDLDAFATFVKRFETELIGMFQHVSYIEQPLPRRLTLDQKTEKLIRKISESKALLIDEADGTVNSYKQAHKIGYLGTSHKNCKGFFKSLLNYALVVHYASKGDATFLSGEDLQNLPVVPLHQDFATLGILNVEHCERNGHHYNHGLSMLSMKDKHNAVKHHPDMYVKRGNEWFLDVRDGIVECASLQCPGFAVHDEPDWPSMMPMQKWIQRQHPA